MSPLSTVILGTGSYAPERILSNVELAKTVDTSDEWIHTRCGIRERRIAAPVKPRPTWASMLPGARSTTPA